MLPNNLVVKRECPPTTTDPPPTSSTQRETSTTQTARTETTEKITSGGITTPRTRTTATIASTETISPTVTTTTTEIINETGSTTTSSTTEITTPTERTTDPNFETTKIPVASPAPTERIDETSPVTSTISPTATDATAGINETIIPTETTTTTETINETRSTRTTSTTTSTTTTTSPAPSTTTIITAAENATTDYPCENPCECLCTLPESDSDSEPSSSSSSYVSNLSGSSSDYGSDDSSDDPDSIICVICASTGGANVTWDGLDIGRSQTPISCGKAIMAEYTPLVDALEREGDPQNVAKYKNGKLLARKLSHPWNVNLKGSDKRCQGTLVEGFKTVITSASCLLSANVSDTAWTATSGVLNEKQNVKVASIYVNESFTGPGSDIAVVVLQDSFQYTNSTNIACLPGPDIVIPDGTDCANLQTIMTVKSYESSTDKFYAYDNDPNPGSLPLGGGLLCNLGSEDEPAMALVGTLSTGCDESTGGCDSNGTVYANFPHYQESILNSLPTVAPGYRGPQPVEIPIKPKPVENDDVGETCGTPDVKPFFCKVKPVKPDGTEITDGDFKAYQLAALDRHNEYRLKHKNTDEMELDIDLCKEAEEYAKKVADLDAFEHETIDAGENAYVSIRPESPEIAANNSANSWYNEMLEYDYKDDFPKNFDDVGHFTQMLWRESTRLGVGSAIAKSGNTYFIARYMQRKSLTIPWVRIYN